MPTAKTQRPQAATITIEGAPPPTFGEELAATIDAVVGYVGICRQDAQTPSDAARIMDVMTSCRGRIERHADAALAALRRELGR